jgi:hypothetical protein
MSRRQLAYVCAVTALCLAGCTGAKHAPVASTPAPEPTVAASVAHASQPAPAEPTVTPTPKTGAIVTPPRGSALRQSLLDAARAKIGSSSSWYVMQLYAQDGFAVGELLESGSPGPAWFFGFAKRGGAWTAPYSAQNSTTTAAKLRGALPGASRQLIAKIRFGLALPDQTGALKTSAQAAALAIAKKNADASIGKLTAGTTRIAQDSKGTWWASVLVKPSNTSVDALSVYLKRTGTTWKYFDLGTGIDPSTDTRFPAEVRDKL